ncbi:MAG: cytochrome c [Deltaproteobacteria bacterium]|nr:cytochrome c [Deltaproteobacteria bacterium]
MNPRTILFVLFAGLFLISGAPLSLAQEETVKERKKLMKSNNKISRALRTAVKEKDYAAIQSQSKKLIANMDKVAALFPKGSTAKDSRALKSIWSDWTGFNDNIGWAKTSANNLSAAAAAKDTQLVKLEYDAVRSACSQCHRSYRKRSRRSKKKKK